MMAWMGAKPTQSSFPLHLSRRPKVACCHVLYIIMVWC